MSKILITGNPDGHVWYAGLKGAHVELIREYEDTFLIITPKGYSNYISKEYSELVRPIKYSTEDLYGTPTLSMLDGEYIYIVLRIEMLNNTLTKENAKHWRGKDMHLVAELLRGMDFWNDRLKEIK